MREWIDLLMVLVAVTNLAILGVSRLRTCIRLSAIQGAMLGCLPLMVAPLESWTPVLLALVTIALKGWALPALLERSLVEANVQREVQPFVGYNASILIGVIAIAASFWFNTRLPLPFDPPGTLMIPTAFFGVLVGLFILVSRKIALNQVIGYLVLENGIYTFGLVLMPHQTLMVELGILLDLFVGVFVMGIAIFQINREFDHINADRMTGLRDWSDE